MSLARDYQLRLAAAGNSPCYSCCRSCVYGSNCICYNAAVKKLYGIAAAAATVSSRRKRERET